MIRTRHWTCPSVVFPILLEGEKKEEKKNRSNWLSTGTGEVGFPHNHPVMSFTAPAAHHPAVPPSTPEVPRPAPSRTQDTSGGTSRDLPPKATPPMYPPASRSADVGVQRGVESAPGSPPNGSSPGAPLASHRLQVACRRGSQHRGVQSVGSVGRRGGGEDTLEVVFLARMSTPASTSLRLCVGCQSHSPGVWKSR